MLRQPHQLNRPRRAFVHLTELPPRRCPQALTPVELWYRHLLRGISFLMTSRQALLRIAPSQVLSSARQISIKLQASITKMEDMFHESPEPTTRASVSSHSRLPAQSSLDDLC